MTTDLSVAGAIAGFEHLPQICIVTHGPDLTVVAFNAAGRALYPGEKKVGSRLEDTFPEFIGQQVLDLYHECFATGTPRQGHEWRFAIEGDAQMTEVYFDFDITPWRDEAGAVVGVVGVASVVTDKVLARQEAELAHVAAETRYRDTLTVLRELQEALLPSGLPVVPGLDISARYLLARDDTAAGGDWFDAVVKPDGRVALVVGDVVGHGVTASAVMGQLRSVLHQRLAAGATLLDALGDLDLSARTIEGARATTICVVEIDPGTGRAEYCTAGHPPPVIVSPTDEPRYAGPTGSGPLGTSTTFTSDWIDLGLDELVVLYSDGLVERPDRTAAQNTVELLQTIRKTVDDSAVPVLGPARTTERVCAQTLEHLTRLGGHGDDMTILAAQRTAPVGPLHLVLPPTPDAVRAVRDELTVWFDRLDASFEDRLVLHHTIGELVTNAVEHALAPPTPAGSQSAPGGITVAADIDPGGTLVCRVADRGVWAPPSTGGDRGRGLSTAMSLVDDLSVRRGSDAVPGTVATVRHRLTRSGHLLTPGTVSRPASHTAPRQPAWELTSQDGTLRVLRPVDLGNAGVLGSAIDRATQGGTRPLAVDLTGATLLLSAGVQVLHRAVARSPVTLEAAYGSPAQHILELVNLPYRATAT